MTIPEFIDRTELARRLVRRDCEQHTDAFFVRGVRLLCEECKLRFEEAWVYPILEELYIDGKLSERELCNLVYSEEFSKMVDKDNEFLEELHNEDDEDDEFWRD